MAEKKTYFYVFLEGDRSSREEQVIQAFERFKRVHELVDSEAMW